ncbi:hypothetical protein Tco_0138114 [Tanacetum coccineum]
MFHRREKDVFVEEKSMFSSKKKNVLAKRKNVSSKRKNFSSKRKYVFIEEKRMFSSKRRYKKQVKVLKEGQNVDLKSKDNVLDSCEQSVEIDRLKQTLSKHVKEKKSLMQTVTLLKNDFKKKESRNIDREIAFKKKTKQLDNILEPKLYDGNVIKNTSTIVIPDSEETLVLAEESHSKMLLKQQDPMMLEKKVNTTPVDYAVLNQRSQNSMNSSDPTHSCRPTKVEESFGHLKHFKIEFKTKLKGKDLADNVVTKHPVAPEMLKVDEQATILREVVKQGKSQNPLNNPLDSACKYTKQIQELLIIIGQTCPSINNSRVKPSTSASGSQPSGNAKKDKIQQTPSSTQKNKVEAHPKTCNGCMLSDNHDLCVLDFINDVNARAKSKSVKKSSKSKVWKPTGKVFTNIGYTWRPTGRTFNYYMIWKCPVLVTLVYSKEPSKSWESIVSDVPSSPLDECRSSKLFSGTVKFRNDHMAKILGYGDYQIGNVTISGFYLRRRTWPLTYSP